jgi:hypothetical protein
VRLKGENERLRSELGLLREQMRIKDARLGRIAPANRPHYLPTERLSERFGKGFSYPSVKRMKQSYLAFPQGSAIPEQMGGYQNGSAPLSFSPGPGVIEKGSTLLSQSARPAPTLFPPLLSWSHYLAPSSTAT